MNLSRLEHILLNITSKGFENAAIELYRMQAEENQVLANFHRLLNHDASRVTRMTQMRFLPVAFFKTHTVIRRGLSAAVEFSSSTTTGSRPGLHPVADPALYEEVFCRIFSERYGDLSKTAVVALLPSYMERTGSSLIYMVDHLIRQSGSVHSGFFLHRSDELRSAIDQAKHSGERVILFAVTFALLQLAESQFDLSGVLVIETGGMKGRGKELIREELVRYVKASCSPDSVDSEYGMTELLSQAYSSENGLLKAPVWMKTMVRETGDPFSISEQGRGLLNIIDLANADSCAFIATDDLVSVGDDGFRILGRADHSEIRGCNLMLSV
jgi:hypothetical protein